MPVDFVLSPPPLYFVFENSKTKRNDLARPVMGTIFLVYTRNVLLSAQMGERASVVLICIITSRYNEVK